MKTLRLELYQETACYKKPLSFKVAETYPLPPYSAVKGMLHTLIGAREFTPMLLSVQGGFDTIFTDYQSHYFFKKSGVSEFPMVLDGLDLNYDFSYMTRMPLYVHMLFEVQLLIHVRAEDNVIEQIIDAIEGGGEPISLGRWEDLLRIDGYETVDIEPLEDEAELKRNAYIPLWMLPEEKGYIPYRLNWKYDIRNGVRRWQKVKVGYIGAGEEMAGDEMYIDSYSDPVFFHAREGEY